ncbi:signal transduction histidine kinase [Kitasatospora sp. MAA4]|uniref:sensor histidine kinase n=1 Tax=Kitasatospora sp. MAA4 TaxID=3035093 RepID=UPI002475E30A|nr:histidine kinase [Kitasatospora sp. MAA4]MDH6136545.1 signal transduction histidine kinase [Kitasatospora sp. MAA4]
MERISRWEARGKELLDRLQWRSGRLNPYVADSLWALASALVSAWSVLHDNPHSAWWVYLLAVSTALPLPWRRRAPFTVFLATGVPAIALSIVAHSAQAQIPIFVVLMSYTIGDRCRDWQRWLLVAIVVPANILGTHSPDGALFSLITSLGPFVFGSVVRGWRRKARAQEERAHQAGERAATEAARAVAEERGRIAREMHDILAHAVSLMVIQAEAGPVVVHSDPERAIKAFDTIADSGRDAMVQLRRVLGVLKEEGAGPELAPQPTLAELPAVAERVRQAGLQVDLQLVGLERTMPSDIEAAAYRIVQEALTNTVKHAGADHAAVRLARVGAVLEIAVCDNGRGVPRTGAGGAAVSGWSGGRGLVGIRERAAACGGRAEAGAGPDGVGFLVTAQLPLGAERL